MFQTKAKTKTMMLKPRMVPAFAIAILLALTSVAFFTAHSAFAEKVLFLSPTRVEINDKNPVAVINVSNLSQISRAYKVSVNDLIMTSEGVTAPVDNFDYSAKRMIRFVPRSFVIKPGEHQTIRIMARFRPDTPDGDYHSHISFLEDISQRNELNPKPQNDGQATIEAPMAYETMIPVILSKGTVTAALNMKDITVKKGPNPGQVIAEMTLTRSGNGQGRAYIDFEYLPPGGGDAVHISTRRVVNIYRELDELKKTYDDLSLPEGQPSGGQVRITLYDSPAEGAKPVDQETLPLSD